MCTNNDEYIQLPPLKRDMETAVVQLIWEYAKLPDEARKEVLEDMELLNLKPGNRNNEMPKKYRKVTKEELADYEKSISNLIRSLIVEASDIASWVFCRKYLDGMSLEQMIEEMPAAEKFIVAMDTLFEKNIRNKDDDTSELTM